MTPGCTSEGHCPCCADKLERLGLAEARVRELEAEVARLTRLRRNIAVELCDEPSDCICCNLNRDFLGSYLLEEQDAAAHRTRVGTEVPQFALGTRVSFTRRGTDQRLEGEVTAVMPKGESQYLGVSGWDTADLASTYYGDPQEFEPAPESPVQQALRASVEAAERKRGGGR